MIDGENADRADSGLISQTVVSSLDRHCWPEICGRNIRPYSLPITDMFIWH